MGKSILRYVRPDGGTWDGPVKTREVFLLGGWCVGKPISAWHAHVLSMSPISDLLGWRPGRVIRWARQSTRNLAIVATALLVMTGAIALGVSSWTADEYRDLEYIGFDVDRVLAVETQLTSWPTRHTGTIYEEMAAQYIASEFIAAGLENVNIEEYPEIEYEVRGASLQLVYYTNGPLGLVPDPRRTPETRATPGRVRGHRGPCRTNRTWTTWVWSRTVPRNPTTLPRGGGRPSSPRTRT